MNKNHKTILGGKGAPDILTWGDKSYPCYDVGQDPDTGEEIKTIREWQLSKAEIKHFYGQGYVVKTDYDLGKLQDELRLAAGIPASKLKAGDGTATVKQDGVIAASKKKK